MPQNRFFILMLLCTILTTTVSGLSIQKDDPVYYGQNGEITVDGNQQETKLEWVKAVIECGNERVGYKNPYVGRVTFPAEMTVNIPKEAPCGQGPQKVDVTAQNKSGNMMDLGDVTLNVQSKNTPPNKGKYLYLRANYKDNEAHRMYNFFLSNEPINDEGDPGKGGLYVQEVDGTSAGDCHSYFKFSNGVASPGFSNIDPELDFSFECGSNDDGYGPQDLVDMDFQDFTAKIKHPNKGGTLSKFESIPVDTWSPVHREGNYEIRGQLIRGYEPESQGGEGPFWYVCREGMDGTVVNAAEEGSNHYKCDTKLSTDDWREQGENEWRSVAECNDGLDNDGKNGVDYSGGDPNCDAPTDNTEGDNGQCANPEPQVAKITFDTETGNTPGGETTTAKGVLHDADSSGEWHRNNTEGACKYNNFDTDVAYTDRGANKFTCFDSTAENEDFYTTGTTPVDADQKLAYCNSLTNSWPEGHPDNTSAVQYFVPEEAIPLGKNRYATDSGYKNKFYQNIHEAEDEHAPNCEEVHGTDSQECDFSPGGASSLTGYYHDNQTWNHTGTTDLQDGPINFQGTSYDGYNPSWEDFESDYMDSWVAVNGSANGTYVARKENSNTNNGSFQGGFAPKCKGAENSAYAWRYTEEGWKCSYPTAGQGEITINFFNTPPTDGKSYAGFQINWSEVKDWSAAFPTQPEGAPIDAEKSSHPVNITAQCWQGKEDNRPSDLSKVANITRSVENQKHLQMATKLPARTGVFGNKYACIFGFKQLLDFKPELSERVEVQGTSDAGVPYVDYYFMTGTNRDLAPINVDAESLDVTLEEVETYAGNTGNITQGVDPWKHFPEGGFDTDEVLRDPEEYYLKRH